MTGRGLLCPSLCVLWASSSSLPLSFGVRALKAASSSSWGDVGVWGTPGPDVGDGVGDGATGSVGGADPGVWSLGAADYPFNAGFKLLPVKKFQPVPYRGSVSFGQPRQVAPAPGILRPVVFTALLS